jgi:cytochrome c oxidase assembly factor CtaG
MPELVLVFWVAPPLIVLGIALIVLCRRRQTQRRRFRRRPS